MKNLTVTRALGTANRWRVLHADPAESISRMVITVQLINNGNALVSQVIVSVNNYDPVANIGRTDRVSVDAAPAELSKALVVEANALALATGYDDAFAAWKAGATQQARREALETWMLTSGVAHSTLAGT